MKTILIAYRFSATEIVRELNHNICSRYNIGTKTPVIKNVKFYALLFPKKNICQYIVRHCPSNKTVTKWFVQSLFCCETGITLSTVKGLISNYYLESDFLSDTTRS